MNRLLSLRFWLVLLAVIVMVYLLFFRWTSESQLKRKQEAFIESMERGKWEKCAELVSDNYSDRWGFSKEEVVLMARDVRSQYLVLVIHLDDPLWDVRSGEGSISGRLRLEGRGFGIAGMIEQEVNSFEGRLTMSWIKESWLPWSWKLIRIDQPNIERPGRYTPGDLMRARQREF